MYNFGMKLCMLQASPGGRRESAVKFVARCDRIDGLVGKKLLLSGGEKKEGGIWLRAENEDGTSKGTAACLVLSTPPVEDNVFPTVNLTSKELKQLVAMGDAEIELLEVGTESQTESKDEERAVEGGGGAEAAVKGILEKDEKKTGTRYFYGEMEDRSGEDGTSAATESAGKTVEKESVEMAKNDDDVEVAMQKMSLNEKESTDSGSSWGGVEVTESGHLAATSSGEESGVLVGRRSESAASPTSESTGAKSFEGTGRGSDWDFGTSTKLDMYGFPIRAGDASIEAARRAPMEAARHAPSSFADAVTGGGRYDERNSSRKIGQRGGGSRANDSQDDAEGKTSKLPLTESDYASFHEEKKSSWLSEGWRLVTGSKKAVNEPPTNWIAYMRLANGAARAFERNDKVNLKRAFDCAASFVSGKDASMQSFTLAAYLCNLEGRNEIEALHRLILDRMALISVTPEPLGLSAVNLRNFQSTDMKPNIVWYDFFSNLVTGKTLKSQTPKDEVLITMFWMWDDCGLFRRKDFNPTLWEAIRSNVGSSFFSRRFTNLKSLLDVEKANTLGALAQPGFNELASFLFENESGKQGLPLLVHAHVASYMLLRFETDVILCGSLGESSDSLWQGFFLCLGRIRFPKQDLLDGIIAAAVHAISFRSIRTFQLYDELVSVLATGVEKRYVNRITPVIGDSLCNDLSGSLGHECSPSMKDVTDLLSSPSCSRLLSSRHGVEAVRCFSKKAMTSSASFGSKLCFIDTVFDKFVSESWPTTTKEVKRFAAASISAASKNVAALERLQVAFQVAVESPSIFTSAGDDKFLEHVSKSMWSDEVAHSILRKPECLRELPLEDSKPGETTLRMCLVDRLEESLVWGCIGLEETCKLVLAVTASSKGPALPSARHFGLVTRVFTSFFSKWNLVDMNDLISLSTTELDLLFKCFAASERNEVMPANDSRRMQQCHERAKSVVSKWTTAFEKELVTKADLHKLYGHVVRQNRCWQLVSLIAKVELPTDADIRTKLVDFGVLEKAIVGLLQGCNDTVSLQAVSRGYGCSVAPESILYRLFSGYGWLLQSGEDPEGCLSSGVLPSEQMLCHLRDDVTVGQDFYDKNAVTLTVCDYFLKTRSILFESLLHDALGAISTLESLVTAVQGVKATLLELIGPDGDFPTIRQAVGTIVTGGNSVDNEMSMLSKCSQLELPTACVESFCVVATLAESTELLQRFVRCCQQFKFAATSDPAFEELSSVVDEVLGDESKSVTVEDCLSASNSLCNILSESNHSSERSLSDIRDATRKHLPGLNLLGVLSAHGEAWTFIRDMMWFGKEGLKQFYEQYSNVTNVLLGNTASYEMSVLTAVEPIVRVISAVGGFHDKATSVAALLQELQVNREVVAFLESRSSLADISQVQRNLTQIRDWFTVGVDEIAAVHVKFDAVRKTGEYCLSLDEDGCDGIGVPVLAIRYVDQGSMAFLQGDELTSFIQHVGLIQHENEMTSSVVNSFVELYQILSTTSRNIAYMESIGFPDSGRDALRCPIGEKNIAHARMLLSDSEASLRKCNSWVSTIRSTHYVSLLFGTDELREVHTLLTRSEDDTDDDDVAFSRHRLTNMLERLSNGSDSYQQRLAVVSDAIDAHVDGHFGNDSSWLLTVSTFLDYIHDALRTPWKDAIKAIKGPSNIILHTLACSNDEFPYQTLRVLQSVYKTRLPKNFEILDGLVDGARDGLAIFFDRVLTFRRSTFVIMNIESLESSLLEIIVSFLSSSTIAMEGIRLHLIHREGSMLHSSPWIRGVRWELDEHQNDDSSEWKGFIVDQRNVDQVSVLWSPRSGAGKSRYINQAMIDSNVEPAKVTIHERSSIESLTEDLFSKFSQGSGTKAVHLNLAVLGDGFDKANSSWVECLNRFFFSLLVLRYVKDSTSSRSFHLGESSWRFYLEFPNSGVDNTAESVSVWLRRNVPVLQLCATLRTPPPRLLINSETRRVCTYLRAYEDGTINRKFEQHANRMIIMVLDESGSMGSQVGNSTALSVATDNALRVFDTHVGIGDTFGVILFDNSITAWIPPQTIVDENHLVQLRVALDQVRYRNGGGTRLYSALQWVFQYVAFSDASLETWVVCLTDGWSSGNDATLRPLVEQSRDNTHLCIIGVNLDPKYEEQMRLMCNKYGRIQTTPNKGFFIHSEPTLDSMNSAFQAVSNSIPVSETFDLDGAVSDEQCHRLIDKYAPDFLDRQDMLLISFWVQFIYRRVKVFDENDSFNYNEEHDALGSTLMTAMLGEVERLISNNQSRDWIGEDHTQLIYDFSCKESPEFRLLCTAPDEMDRATRSRLEQLDLPGFTTPTNQDLQQRSTLDRYLSQALNLPLREGRLVCIDENGFILTLDFTMKLLSIHERVACRTPCVIEGETGVSKTALTRMFAILRNSVIAEEAKQLTQQHLEEVAESMVNMGYRVPFGFKAHERVTLGLSEASNAVIGNETEFARHLCKVLGEKCDDRTSVFQEAPADYSNEGEARNSVAKAFLDWFCSSALEPMFFDVNVDSSLTEQDFVERFAPIRMAARKLRESDAIVVVFLDEFNTSSVLGLCKEIIVDHSLAGQPLEDNIVVIAACNPARKQVAAANPRERDLGKEWAGGHYQVAELPPSIAKIKWAFGSLNHDQEKEFIHRRLEVLHASEGLPAYLRVALTEYISESQEAMRQFAARNIRDSLVRVQGEISEEVDAAADVRARSVVSLRDIQRVFSLFDFFVSSLKVSCTVDGPATQTHRNAMLLAVSTVYFLRLDGESREQFLCMTRELPAERHEKSDLLDVLNSAMDELIRETEIPVGIAITRGLKENIFMTFVCTLSRTPLMIVGPAGSSKTLSVNIVADNCNGEDSPSPFYREHARLALFHYQCSKQSTSKELLAVFDKASQRQERVDSAKHRCFVLMDEAGLPEEEKESLKVLHYLLEGHMSAKCPVGFVAISNHVLDAAKTNRCVMLLREEPDEADMLSIAHGVLFDVGEAGISRANHVDLEGALVPANEFALRLCQSYASLLHDEDKLSYFNTFFGLRDMLYFLKSIHSQARFEQMKMVITFRAIVRAVERNFNGVSRDDLGIIAERFLRPLVPSTVVWSKAMLDGAFRDPVQVIRDALSSSNGVSSLSSGTRFKCIVDGSGDDSILRLLGMGGVVALSKRSMFKLSRMPQEVALEELRLVSKVKFAALQGQMAVLSQTESINESFYDLFNQRFQAVTGRDGQVDLYCNIAVGGVSRRSLIRPEFECVVHVSEADLPQMPAPFLNRFEKFRLTIEDVLVSGWESLGALSSAFKHSRECVSSLVSVFEEIGAVGWVNDRQTLGSLFIDTLRTPLSGENGKVGGCWEGFEDVSRAEAKEHGYIANVLLEVVQNLCSMRPTINDIHVVIKAAMSFLHKCDADWLKMFSEGGMEGTTDIEELSRSLIKSNCDKTQESQVFRILLQMLMTRVTVRRLLQLATPESVFAAREYLPQEVVQDYFSQEHFSLKALVGQLVTAAKRENATSFSIVYTRTDSSIQSIPTHSVNRDVALEDRTAAERLSRLVTSDLDELIVENLSVLKSEAMLSSAIESWANNEKKRILVLLVDMGTSNAFEKVNYARMCVERNAEGVDGKVFVLLLHYPSSGRDGRSSYPALFLGGWEHFYLDGIGSEYHSLGIVGLIEAACNCGSTGDLDDLDSVTSCIAGACELLLPRVLPHVASQKLFYPAQLENIDQTSFRARSAILQSVLQKQVGNSDVATILCQKFGSMWADHGLLNSMKRATRGLMLGLTNVSLSLSMRTVLVETFDTFMAIMITEMNQWRNLDLLLDPSTSGDICELYGRILPELPMMPFDELVLQGKTHAVQVLPIADPRNDSARVRFPFFQFVSTFIDECIEKAEQMLAQEQVDNTYLGSSDYSGNELFQKAVELLREDAGGERCNLGRARPVLTVVDFVKNGSKDNSRFLFAQYLSQFVEWRFGCDVNRFVLNQITQELEGFGCGRNIVAVHVVAKVRNTQLVTAASFEQRLLDSRLLGVDAISSRLQEIGNAASSTGEALFEVLLDYFEANVFSDDLDNSEWAQSFSLFVHQTPAMLGGKVVEDLRVACRLRVLCFFNVLIEASAATTAQPSVGKVWKARDSMSDESLVLALSLERFLSPDDDGSELVRELVLRQFFAPSWLNVTLVFKNSDSSFLMKAIAEGTLNGVNRQLLVALLRQTCFHNQNPSRPPSLSEAISSGTLIELGSLLSCDQISTFSSDGKRMCIPHFVPDWLQRDGAHMSQRVLTTAETSIYLANYKQCFRCPLSELCFCLFLQLNLCEVGAMSSENLYAGLVRCIHEEVSVDRQTQTRLSRSRRVGGEQSIHGSSLAAIMLDVQLICFVAKVAQEVSVSGNASVLSGPYAGEASALIEELMSMGHLKWQEFLVSTILRTSGEGGLVSALDTDEQLGRMEWSQEWRRGMPTEVEGAVERLKQAEDDLAEAIDDEEQKRDLRLCPHCRQPFSILQLNCGAFTCGRDFHGGQDGHGCGQTFQIDTAPRYVPDETRLAPLRDRVAREQAGFRAHEHAATLWDRARGMQVPVVSFLVERNLSQRSILPSSSLLSQGDSEPRSSVVSLVEVLLEGSRRESHFKMLPDLIAFYVWLHATFRYLVTKERAFTFKVSDVVKEALLRKRFDSVSASHVASLWERVASGVNRYLDKVNHKIAWECEEIQVPFKTLEDAPLIAVLSEGEHPTDSEGNDVLFLVINGIIGEYNSFVRRLAECEGMNETLTTASDRPQEVHPKFVATGCGGAIAMSAVMPLSLASLNTIAASHWDPEEECYDVKGLGESLRREIGLHHAPPTIFNPSKCLRERFRFRDDQSGLISGSGVHLSVHVDEEGSYFANHQDYRLANDARQNLESLEMAIGDASIRRTLSDNFRSFDYSQLRQILEGCRNLLASMSMAYLDFESVTQALRETFTGDDSSFAVNEALDSFGFPNLASSHVQLLTSLNNGQFVELVRFLSYQLASEAHLFAALPLCMTDPLNDNDRDHIDLELERLREDRGGTTAAECLEEFARDVLAFYESEIRDAALSSNRSLKTFLVEQNFCDDLDAIFSLLPTRVSLHNYVSLRQHLHQRKLALLSSEPVSTSGLIGHDIDSKTVELFTRPSRGRCWLWQDEGIEGHDDFKEDHDAQAVRHDENWTLWFEEGSPEAESRDGDDHMDVDMESLCDDRTVASDGAKSMDIGDCLEDSNENEKELLHAVRVVEKWWRRQRSQFERGHEPLDDVDYANTFDVVEEEDGLLDSESTKSASSPSTPGLQVSREGSFLHHGSGVENPSPQAHPRSSSEGVSNQHEVVSAPVQNAAPLAAAAAITEEPPSANSTIRYQYGSADAVQAMRQWLDDNRLPQQVADALVIDLGARDLQDVMEIVQEVPEMLEDAKLKPLDIRKLKKAVKRLLDEET